MTHWTESTYKDFLYRIADDFIVQIEDKMESLDISQDELAQMLGVTKGRVSQILNNPGNMKLGNIVKYARTLGMKVSIVAYEDQDPDNINGPINAEIFKICWEKYGSPKDFWEIEKDIILEDKLNYANSQSFFGDSDDRLSSICKRDSSAADRTDYADDYKREETHVC